MGLFPNRTKTQVIKNQNFIKFSTLPASSGVLSATLLFQVSTIFLKPILHSLSSQRICSTSNSAKFMGISLPSPLKSWSKKILSSNSRQEMAT